MTAWEEPSQQAQRQRAGDVVLLERNGVTIGIHRCPPSDPSFRSLGPIQNHSISFPRRPVWFSPRTESRSYPILGDGRTALLLNRGSVVARRQAAETGACCFWLGFAEPIARELAEVSDPTRRDALAGPFRAPHGTLSFELATRVERLIASCRGSGRERTGEDALFEEALALGTSVVRHTSGFKTLPPGRRDIERVEAAKAILGSRLSDPVPLPRLAQALSTSVTRLCDSFRRVTGTTIHHYGLELRLLASLQRIVEPGADLSKVAHELGFSSHSHYAFWFRKAFAVSPSAYRGHARRPRSMRSPRPNTLALNRGGGTIPFKGAES